MIKQELLDKSITASEKDTALFFDKLGLECVDLSYRIFDGKKVTGEIDGIFLDRENEIIVIYDDSEQKDDTNAKILKFFNKWLHQNNEKKIFHDFKDLPYYPIYILYIDKHNEREAANTKSIEYVFTDRTHIIYKDDFEYFDKLCSTIGAWTKNDLYNHIDVTPTKSRAEIEAIQIYIGDTPAYLFADRADRILKYCYVARRRGNDEGYQRMVDFNRIKDIQSALENDKILGFPNSILLNSSIKLAHKPLSRSECPGTIKFTIPNHFAAFKIVDGQHRLLSFSQLSHVRQTKYILPIVLLDNMNLDEEIRMFLDINDSPKVVDPSLRYELVSLLNWKVDDDEYLIKIAVNVIRILEKKNPIKGNIYSGIFGTTKKENITLKSFVDSLTKHRIIHGEGGVLQDNINDVETPAKLIQEMLVLISKDGRNRDYFLSNRGIELVCNYLYNLVAGNPTINKEELINKHSGYFMDAVNDVIENIKKYQGDKGAKDTFDDVISAINNRVPDENNISNCGKVHEQTDDIISDLPIEQGGSGRHKCASCAYEEGYSDGLKGVKREIEVINRLIAYSQKGKRRHKSTTKAYDLGYENGSKQAVNA